MDFFRQIHIITTIAAVLMATMSYSQTYGRAGHKTTVEGDTVYIFKNWDNAYVGVKTSGESEIEWAAFDEGKMDFSKILKTSRGTSDTLNIGEKMGVRCRVTQGEKETVRRMWVDVQKVDSVIFSIDSVDCEAMYVTAQAYGNVTKVYGMQSKMWSEVKQKYRYSWYVADTLQLTTNSREPELETPLSDCAVKVVAENSVGNMAEATDSVGSYGVRAKFKYTAREHNIDNEVTTAEAYSAPTEIEFTNESKGAYTVSEWEMGKVSRLFEANPVYSFQKTGKHKVKLIVTDESTGCQSVDSTLEVEITDAFLGFPNVFTPNGDGVNDEFKPAYKSLRDYELTIFNRWGRKVFHSTDPSEGWDGKEGNSNAAEGVYMYVAEAYGYDDGVHLRRHGSVTIVR